MRTPVPAIIAIFGNPFSLAISSAFEIRAFPKPLCCNEWHPRSLQTSDNVEYTWSSRISAQPIKSSIILPKKEFELLELLASRPGTVFTRDQILSLVWGNDAIVGERTIDVHIRKLREKLGNDYIRTIKGVGYTFSEIWKILSRYF